jgi:hypothetical protein
MGGLFLSFSHPPPILLVGLLVLSTHLSWAQRTSPIDSVPIQSLDTPAPFARVSEAQTCLHLIFGRLPLTLGQNQGQAESPMFSRSPGYYRVPVNTNAAPYPATRKAELRHKESYFIGSAPSKWLTFAPSYSNLPHETTYRVEDLEHYAHHMPWAGSIILRICQQAKDHPRVTRLITVLKPRF